MTNEQIKPKDIRYDSDIDSQIQRVLYDIQRNWVEKTKPGELGMLIEKIKDYLGSNQKTHYSEFLKITQTRLNDSDLKSLILDKFFKSEKQGEFQFPKSTDEVPLAGGEDQETIKFWEKKLGQKD